MARPEDVAAEREVGTLYRQLLEAWNQRSAANMAALFEDDGGLVGFDGSQIDGRSQIEPVIGEIFAHHPTPAYVAKIRGVRLLAPDIAVLRAVTGLVPPGQSDIDPALNAIQTLVAVKRGGAWRIAHFQNTPAQFHGRPELVRLLTEELRQLL